MAGYTALTTFYAEFDTYASCLPYMGYNPSGEKASRYYGIGLSNGGSSDLGEGIPNVIAVSNGASECVAGDETENFFPAGKGAASPASFIAVAKTIGWVKPTDFFIEENAIFNVSGSTYVWSINPNKQIINHEVGY